MKLILGGGAGSGYYPYTQKPIAYQPYRPIYLYQGPPPDAGFSYGLFEDDHAQKQYYAELGLEPLSPFSGKPSKLLKEVEYDELKRDMDEHWKHNKETGCEQCGMSFVNNFHEYIKGKDDFYYCHRCGSKL